MGYPLTESIQTVSQFAIAKTRECVSQTFKRIAGRRCERGNLTHAKPWKHVEMGKKKV